MALTQISTDGIKNGTITNADLASNAAIDSSKINTSGLDADTLDGIEGASFLRSDANDTLGGILSYTSDTPRLQFTNSTFGTSLYIGGYTSSTNSTNISRIRTSTGNLHIDSASNGGLYLNHYSTGTVYVRGNRVLTTADEGSGNGLDADTLDGQQGSYYADAASYVKEIETDDNITTRMGSGFYETSTATTAEGWPVTSNNYYHLISSTHSNTGNYYSMQIAGDFFTQDNFYIRSTNASGTRAWSKIWTSSSDGAGSGLDADTLDGIQASSFVRSDAVDSSSENITINGLEAGSWVLGSTYKGLFHTNQSGAEYMIISQDDHTFISASSGSNVYLRNGGNDATNQLIVGAGNDGLTWRGNKIFHAGNDGSGSGLDADTLDGQEGSYYTNAANLTGTLPAIDGSNLTGITQTTINNNGSDRIITGSQTANTLEAESNLGFNGSTMSIAAGSSDEKIKLFGTNPYIRFLEGSTEKAYIQWNANGWLQLQNQESGEDVRIKSGANGLIFRHDGTESKVFHAGNDGSGSGLDADTVDGIQASSFIRSDTADTASEDITFDGGAGAVSIAANSDIRLTNGSWTGESCKIQHHDNRLYIQGGSNGIQLRGSDGGGIVNFTNTSGTFFDPVGFSGDVTCSGGAGAISINGGSDIRFTSGNWTGNSGSTPKIQAHSNYLYIVGGPNGIIFREDGTDRWYVDGSGHFRPASNNTYDIGTSSHRVRNIYTNDLNLSNEGGSNDVDGTWGSYTIQEGAEDLFLVNRRNGKKYKFNLTEVS